MTKRKSCQWLNLPIKIPKMPTLLIYFLNSIAIITYKFYLKIISIFILDLILSINLQENKKN